MPSITTAVFDFGGVMTTTTMPERVRRCVKELGVDWSILETGYARYRRLTDGGFITLDDMYELIWADADIRLKDEDQARILEEDYASFMDNYRNLRTRDWMRELKAEGLRIGILTNMPPSMVERFHRTYADFIELGDALVISGEERMFKPQRRIYELTARRLGRSPGEICFIDDSEANCEGARAAGWRAIRFENNEQVERDFVRLRQG